MPHESINQSSQSTTGFKLWNDFYQPSYHLQIYPKIIFETKFASVYSFKFKTSSYNMWVGMPCTCQLPHLSLNAWNSFGVKSQELN